MNLDGNTILVTGGTSGIGRALAVAFNDRGNRVIVTGRRRGLLDAVEREHPGILGLPLDLDDPAAVADFGREVRLHFPDLNVVIANAGISRTEDMTADHWTATEAEAVVRTNILGVLAIAAEVLPILKGQPNATFMATSSALAFVPRADFPTYCATKAFLHSWLVSMRHQLRHLPVEVLELSPPYVQTELTGAAQTSDPRAMPLDAFVAEVMDLLGRGAHPGGEVVLARDQRRRWAERDGTYAEVFAMLNPA